LRWSIGGEKGDNIMNLSRFARATNIAGICALGLGVGLALPACSSGTSSAAGTASAATPSASAPAGAAHATTSPVATSAAAVPATPTTAATPRSTLVPMQTAAGGEFLSPSGNISCEVDYHRAGLTRVYCQTAQPARSVTMGDSGRYTTCTGQQCLANAGDGTPTLAYGKATGVGPFRCESAATGITCVADGQGFRLSTSGITPASA
jgi:hypothetical protein